MWIPLIIIALVMAFALSPLLWILPTRSQRAIARLRDTGARMGLRVRLAEPPAHAISSDNDRSSIAVYTLAWRPSDKSPGADRIPETLELEALAPKRNKREAVNWCLVKRKLHHDIHFCGHWQWLSSTVAPQCVQPLLKSIVVAVPDDVIAFAAEPQGVSVYWWERGGVEQLEDLASKLESIRDVLEQE